ncbi:MAG: hypothetical protein ABIF87_08985, partial [Pseudomonadota bacterium]
MKRSIAITALAFFLVSALFSSNIFAESQADKYLGERDMCLDVIQIKETRILDDQTILFETLGGAIYISRLPARCTGLWIAGGFSYKTTIRKLCKQEIIQVVGPGGGLGSKCGMGEFVRVKDVRRLSDAVKLLENGTLEALVEE